MIKSFSNTTVGFVVAILFPAVFFSLSLSASENRLGDLETGLNDLIYDLSQSVVTIEASEPVYPNNYSGIENEAVYNLVSTGIIYDTLGRVITLAQSVVGKSIIGVKFEDRTIPARIEAIDHQTGLALLQLFKPFGVPAKLSNQSGCAGQVLLALGNSYGLRVAPSLGFCSGMRPDGFMQFSAQFSSGAHGGGLFSLSGELVGIITGEIENSEQNRVGLSLPAYKIKEIVMYLLENGDRKAGFLGLTTAEIEISPPIEISYPGQLAFAATKKNVISEGVIITDIVPSSPASTANLKIGDILFEVNGIKIKSASELANLVLGTAPGNFIEFHLLRHNSTYLSKVKVGEKRINSMFNQGVNEVNPSQGDIVTDSILKEITRLKKSIEYLENSLKRLR